MFDKIIGHAAGYVRGKYEQITDDIAKGIREVILPSHFKGYTIDYSDPVGEACPNCGHTVYNTDDPSVAFCPFCRKLLDLEY